uniref:Hydrogenase 3 maturation endopeptidase HyCI n=1 Tax=candidate division WOR-3 bacterium TaxID=2052148 RepID=A0A7C4GBL5_UNCW3
MLREGRETAEGETGKLSGSTVVIGVGNRLRGDDAVGCSVIDALKGKVAALLFDAESAPENFIEPAVETKPTRILFIDACDFGGKPGEFKLFGREEIGRLALGLVSTHTLPLTLTAELLEQRTGAEVWLLGVQPARLEFGAQMSRQVAKALPAIVEFVRDWLSAAPPDNAGSQL